jgi:hypothetical protein
MPKGSGKDKWFRMNWRVANAKVKQCIEEIAVASKKASPIERKGDLEGFRSFLVEPRL